MVDSNKIENRGPRSLVLICSMPWKPRVDPIKLKRQNDELAFQLLRAREQLQKSEGYNVGLEALLIERLKRIDELNGKLEQLREQNRRLDEEAERLAEMVRFAPPVDAAALSPK